MDKRSQKRAPVYEALEAFARKRVVPFDVPGHKRGRGNPELVQLLGEKCVGLDVNSTDPADWKAAYDKLDEQNDNCIYLMDEIYDKMEMGNAAAAAYYAGDCLQMMQENEDLAFYYPKEGTNVFVDSMVIPKSAKNVGAAKLFIDFMLDPRVATENANYICYASPNVKVRTNPEYDYCEGTDEYAILYELPDSYKENPALMQYYHTLDDETQKLMDDYWMKLGIGE